MTTLMRWDPMRDLWGMQRDLDRLMSAFTTVSSPSSAGAATSALSIPTMDVVKSGEDLVLRAEMPGIKPADIDISIVNGMLTLKGERHTETETKDEDYVVRESTYGSFERSVKLPEGFDPKSIRAEYRDGVLEVTGPGAAVPMEAGAIHVPISTPEPEKLEGHH
jgi:HSP20 family protein